MDKIVVYDIIFYVLKLVEITLFTRNCFLNCRKIPRDNTVVPLNQNNVMLRGCIMRNTDWIEGLVVYAGKGNTKVLFYRSENKEN